MECVAKAQLRKLCRHLLCVTVHRLVWSSHMVLTHFMLEGRCAQFLPTPKGQEKTGKLPGASFKLWVFMWTQHVGVAWEW